MITKEDLIQAHEALWNLSWVTVLINSIAGFMTLNNLIVIATTVYAIARAFKEVVEAVKAYKNKDK